MKIGVITTGHGPREEYVHYHRALLQHLGADVQIVLRHALEGLSFDDLRPHFVGQTVPNIGVHIRVSDATGNAQGPGWEHPFVALTYMVGRFQKMVDLLEQEDEVDLIILACAAEVPDNALLTNVLFVHPRDLMFDMVAQLARWSRRKLKIGHIVSIEHAQMDKAAWEEQSWYDRIELHMAPISAALSVPEAARQLGSIKPDLVFYFGYGFGLAPFIPEAYVSSIEASLAAPLIVPHRITTLFARNLLRPCLNDRRYLPSNWWKS